MSARTNTEGRRAIALNGLKYKGQFMAVLWFFQLFLLSRMILQKSNEQNMAVVWYFEKASCIFWLTQMNYIRFQIW